MGLRGFPLQNSQQNQTISSPFISLRSQKSPKSRTLYCNNGIINPIKTLLAPPSDCSNLNTPMPSPYRLAVFSKRFKSLQLARPPEQNPEYGSKQLDPSLSRNAHLPKAYSDPTRLPDMRPSQGLVVSAPSSDLLVEEVVRVSDDGGTVALSVYTTGPYVEFRRSMQEMVDAHQPLDRGFMKELLLCYLKMNEKKQHKLIVAAFLDLMDMLETNCRLQK